MQNLQKVFFSLLAFEFGKELSTDVKNLITQDMLKPLYAISKKHDLAHLLCDALDKNGFLLDGTEACKYFLQERNIAIYRYEQLEYEYEQICNVFEQNKIEFIPLKGCVIRKFYPEPWMRTSCDIEACRR